MGKDKRKRDELGALEQITKSAKVILVASDGTSLPVGDFTLTMDDPGPTLDDFADHAFKECRASLSKLMVPQYRLVVTLDKREQGYGLDRWVKLEDRSSPEYEPRKQRIRKKAAA